MSHTAAAAAPSKAAASPSNGVLTHRQIMTILIGLMLGMFLAALDQTIVSTAIRKIADDLHGLDQMAWATTAYLITSTIATPLYGKLSDMYGRKPFFLAAILIFIAGSVACTFATSMYELAAFRAFQGLGGGGLMSLALAIIGDIVAPRERAKYQGYFLAVFGTSSVLGPVLGGYLAGQHSILGLTGWRWVFLINVPIAAIALIVVTKVLNVPHAGRRHKIDWAGALFLIVGLVPLLIVAEQGREWGWTSTRSLAAYGIGVLGIVAFIIAEKFAKDEALIPLRLFRNPVISLMSVGGFIVGMAMFGGIAILPQYLQIVHGASATKSGFLMLPMVLGMMVGSIVSGQITARTGRYKIFPIIGTALMVAALLLLHTIGADTALWQVNIFMAMLGLGLGNCMQTLTLAVQNAAPPKDMGVSSATSTFFRQMGGTLGTAVFISVLFSTVGDKITNAFKEKSIQHGIAQAAQDPSVLKNPLNVELLKHPAQAAKKVVSDSSFLSAIDDRLARPFLVGFSNSMDLVFLLAAGVAAIAFFVFLFTKEVPLRSQSGTAARLSAESAEAGADPAAIAAAEPTAMVPDTEDPVSAGGRHAADAAAEPPADPAPALAADPTAPAPVIGTPIRGYVRQAGGAVVTDAALTLIDPAGQQMGRGITAQDGGYQIAVDRPGNYVLIARARAHQPQATMVTVNGNPVQLDLTLAGSAGLVGAVKQTGDRPIPGAAVILADADGNVVGSQSTDTGGSYEFVELVAGSYTLAVSAPSYQPVALLVTVPDVGRVRQDIELAGGAQLRGVARSSDGRLVPGARVSLRRPDGTEIAATITDDAGRYAFTEVPEGDYTVVASGYAPVRSSLTLSIGDRHEHDVELSHSTD
ncbi:MFS transporter [Actinocatenispora thailandica]|uniref:alpha-amylase n=1 Tax=Actinocatenispora thailandica TaxID=227318 RepID=A0A7R7DJ29_9ACTN|nr:MFS transporter [Actinocatenispora thailandica]BCJ32605.1 MFS transporter [Actinocatenispora thailandica]